MMHLPEVLRHAGMDLSCPAGAEHLNITGISADSRHIGPGMIFAALRGTHQDGRAYIAQAMAAGAAALLLDTDPAFTPPPA